MSQKIEIVLALMLGALSSLGWLVHPIGYLALAVGIALLLHVIYEWLTKQRKPSQNSPDGFQRAPERATERPLTDDEKDLLEITDLTIQANHGHSDWVTLAEDCLKGRELSAGICGVCGQPRNRLLRLRNE